jgi:hypothetical protein
MKWKQIAPGIYVAPADGAVQFSVVQVNLPGMTAWAAYQTTRRHPKNLGTFGTDKLARSACETEASKLPPTD